MNDKKLKIKIGKITYELTTTTPWFTQKILDIPSINEAVRNHLNKALRKEKIKQINES